MVNQHTQNYGVFIVELFKGPQLTVGLPSCRRDLHYFWEPPVQLEGVCKSR